MRTNYHRLFDRDASGALQHNGLYKCSGCQLKFSQASQWCGVTVESGDLAGAPDPHRSPMQDRPGMALA